MTAGLQHYHFRIYYWQRFMLTTSAKTDEPLSSFGEKEELTMYYLGRINHPEAYNTTTNR